MMSALGVLRKSCELFSDIFKELELDKHYIHFIMRKLITINIRTDSACVKSPGLTMTEQYTNHLQKTLFIIL